MDHPAVRIAIALLIALTFQLIFRKLGIPTIKKITGRTKTKWDDLLLNDKVLKNFSWLIPALLLKNSTHFLNFSADFEVEKYWHRFTEILVLFSIIGGINAIIDTFQSIYGNFTISRHKPVKGYAQLLKVLNVCMGVILLIAILLQKNPLTLLTGIGALSAVLMLVFKDSILSLVASVQLSANDMVRLGDWIVVPGHSADGDVIDISLHTVKVQNWDKTIATVPTYDLITGSFINWRGMSDSGGRRIKRSINIDMNSVTFCDENMLQHFSKIGCLSDYIENKQKEIMAHNDSLGLDLSLRTNGRRLTNLGTFRAYLIQYLKSHPMIHQDMTFLVRHLAPTSEGIPIEIYVFSKDQVWANYEAIQADLFDHILAVLPEFELRVFQNPTGADFRQFIQH